MAKFVGVVLVVASTGCASAVKSDFEELRSDATPQVAAPDAVSGADVEAAIGSIPTAAAGSDQGQGPEVQVSAQRVPEGELYEERLIGTNRQPEWTTERRFATTRAYVLAPGQIEVEQWMKTRAPRHDGPTHSWQTEIGMGFEGGWQLDVYENYGRVPHGPTTHDGVAFEGRYALANWNEIALNPTLYVEYKWNHDAADAVEGKILLADDFGASGWHWAGNLFVEQETDDAKASALGASTGLSYAILDSEFSVGAEAKYERVTVHHRRDDPVNELLAGPSFQWRPMENVHVDFVPLFGLTKSDRRDPRYEVYLVLGIDFGPEREGARRGPTSTRSR